MNTQSAYNIWANKYDEDLNLTRDLDGDIVRKEFDKSKFESIIEIGCGTGKNTIFYSSISNHLTALDFSESMISKANYINLISLRNGNFLLTSST